MGINSKRMVSSFIMKNWLPILYLIVTLIFSALIIFRLNIAIYFLFCWIGFGWSIFFFRDKISFLEHLLLSPAFFVVMFLPFVILFALFQVKLSLILGLLFIVLSLGVFFISKSLSFETIKFKLEKYDLAVVFLLLLSLGAKVLSVRNAFIPNLHDPITHAYYAQTIVDTGMITFFYSPGLHILSAFSFFFNGFEIPLQILFITNFFNAYLGVVAYIFIKRVYKNVKWGIVTSFLLFLGLYPANLYLQSGKNALVLGLVILVFLIYVVSLYLQQNTKRIAILINFGFLSIFILHYPVAVFACLFLLAFFVFNFRISFSKYAYLSLGIILGFVWLVKMYIQQTYVDPFQADLDVKQTQLGITGNFLLSQSLSFIKTFLLRIKDTYYNSYYVVQLLGLIGVILSLYSLIKKKNKNSGIIILWSIFSLFLSFILYIFNLQNVYIVVETFLIITFLYLYIFAGQAVGWIINYLIKHFKSLFLWAFIIILSLIFALHAAIRMYSDYEKNTFSYTVLTESDVAVFDWIEENTSEDAKILINSAQVNNYIYSTDGGGWLEIYTGREISAPFYKLNWVSVQEAYEKYKTLDQNPSDCESLSYFDAKGYDYYYQGSKPVFSSPFADYSELIGLGWEVAFSSGNAVLFEVPACQ